jgi:uncharacterized oxidoreductase
MYFPLLTPFSQWDLTDLANIQNHVKSILADYPKLDTVFINAGIQNHCLLFQEAPNTDEVVREITTNLTAPTLVAQSFAPHLLSLAQSGVKTSLFLTSSSLGYFPISFYPTYCATKAGIAAFAKILRMQLAYTGCTNLNIVEVVPPYIDTALNAHHRAQTDALQGGPDKATQPMALSDYIENFFTALEETEADGSLKKEIGVGFGAQGVSVWRGAFEKLYQALGLSI